MRTMLYVLLTAVTLVAAGIVSGDQPSAQADQKPAVIQEVTSYQNVTRQSGWLNTSRPLVPDDLRGRILLLDFWTFCCINCIHIIPDLQALEQEFGNKLTVLGIHSAKFKNEQDSENIRQAILRYGIEHPVVNDFDFTIWQAFGVNAWPTLVLINPKGEIEQTYSGEGNKKDIEKDVNRLLKAYGDTIITSPLPLALEKDKAPPTILKFPGKLIHVEGFDGKDVLMVSDSNHNRIVVMTTDGNIIDSIGSGVEGKKDGDFASAQFNTPQGLTYRNGHLYVADTENHLLRDVNFADRTVVTIAGTGAQGNDRFVLSADALTTPLSSPWDLAFFPDDNHLAIAMAGLHQLWSYDVAQQTVGVIAGSGRESLEDGTYPLNALSQPSGLSVHDGKLYFVDSETSSLRVLERGHVKTLIGTGLFDFGYREGTLGTALMQHPLGLFADDSGIYVADSYNHSIRRYDPATKLLSNFAGHGERGTSDGARVLAAFNEPSGITKIGSAYYIADTNNHAVRRIDADGTVTTVKITVPKHEEAAQWAEFLPNTLPFPPVTVAAGQKITVTIGLKPGWKINHDAPSYLALFDEAGPHALRSTYALEVVKKRTIALPALTPDTAYRLQGSVYYCEDKEGAECLIAGIDLKIEVTHKEGATKITLPVQE